MIAQFRIRGIPMPITPFGAWLRETRKAERLTLREVAEAANCSATYISDIERGAVRRPTEDMVRRLSRALRRPEPEGLTLAGYFVPPFEADGETLRLQAALQRLQPQQRKRLVDAVIALCN